MLLATSLGVALFLAPGADAPTPGVPEADVQDGAATQPMDGGPAETTANVVPEPAAAAAVAPGVAPRGRRFVADPLAVTEVTLDNGLRVFLTENHERPEVFGAVVVNTGAKNDPADNTGMAHYLEHMLFKGTQALGTTDWAAEQGHQAKIEALYEQLRGADEATRARVQGEIKSALLQTYAHVVPNEMDQLLRQLGGRGVNAFTSYDETVYHNTFPASAIDGWLEIYAHRFVDPVFRLFPSELEAVYEEKNIALDTTGYKAFRVAMRAAFPDHPYGGSDILGEVEHLKRPSLSVMRTYFETHYVPGNMALVLSGDFDTAEVLKTVDATFGTWEAKPLPPPAPGRVGPFERNERVGVRATPVRAGAIAYRTVPESHPDYAALRIIRQLLSNEQRSGLLDELADSSKVLFAVHVPADFADHNLDAVVFVPRVLTQTFRGAERVVSKPFEQIAAGEFDAKTFAAIKAGLLAEEAARWEDNEERALALGHAFVARDGWQGHLDYLARLESLTSGDVAQVAARLFGDRRLRVRSRMGFPKKTRLDKPEVPPVKARPGQHSAFYRHITEQPAALPQLRPVDFGADITRVEVQPGVRLTTNPNPFNDLYQLEVRFGVGHLAMRELQLVADYLPRTGAGGLDPQALRERWFTLGTTFEVRSELDALVVTLSGPQQHLDAGLALLATVLTEASENRDAWKQMRRERWGFRRLALREPRAVGEALRDWVLYEDLSAAYRDYGPQATRAYKPQHLVRSWKRAQAYEADVRYAGPANAAAVAASLRAHVPFAAAAKPAVRPVVLPRRLPEETTVYFVPRRDAVQTQLWFAVQGEPVRPSEAAAADAFAEYFGGSMAGLVFQEVREFRALAYSAAGRLQRDEAPQGRSSLLGFVGCQADKTFDAMDVMLGLIREMPRYPERLPIVRASLQRGLEASSPSFRDLQESVATWQQRGYASDPRVDRLAGYGELSFADIEAFYARHVADRPVAIMVVGDPRVVRRKTLETYGPVVELRASDLLTR